METRSFEPIPRCSYPAKKKAKPNGYGLGRRHRMNPVSEEKLAAMKVRKAFMDRMRQERSPTCEIDGCPEPWAHGHERLPRSGQGSDVDEENVALLCERHHRKAHARPLWAYSVGLKVSRYPGRRTQ